MRKLTDVHVHLAALPTPQNGCRVSRRLLGGPVGRLVSRDMGLPLDQPEQASLLYLERLRAELLGSARVGRAVLLGMDGAYDESGRLDEEHTDFLIGNDYVLECSARAPALFLAGVSVNPQRRDALDELERCAARGAALVKVLANSQRFDPALPRYRPFYKVMARLKLPLLAHVGFEFSLIGHDQSVGDLGRLVPALEEGVTVIAAHGCSTGLFFAEKHWALMGELVRRFPRFYADVSALTLFNRVGQLLRIARHPELFGRLLFGTDYPLPVYSYPCLLAGAGGAWAASRAAANRFDRQVLVLEALGVELRADFADLAGGR
ncbi:MAG: amidohydrolase family protein [Elusimicrobia bacterium]|nr:amidohydrolase family protein [Elusimicrobiota bacterium]